MRPGSFRVLPFEPILWLSALVSANNRMRGPTKAAGRKMNCGGWTWVFILGPYGSDMTRTVFRRTLAFPARHTAMVERGSQESQAAAVAAAGRPRHPVVEKVDAAARGSGALKTTGLDQLIS